MLAAMKNLCLKLLGYVYTSCFATGLPSGNTTCSRQIKCVKPAQISSAQPSYNHFQTAFLWNPPLSQIHRANLIDFQFSCNSLLPRLTDRSSEQHYTAACSSQLSDNPASRHKGSGTNYVLT